MPKKVDIKLVIPPEMDAKYNYALTELERGENTLVGDEAQLAQLDVAMQNPEIPSALLVGEQGSGKTAVVEQWDYNKSITDMPEVIVSLAIEKLGELAENVVIGRIRSLLGDMQAIKEATEDANPGKPFQMTLFIDEVHKLNRIGYSNGSSGAMNALKEGLARGKFRIIAATTDYEYLHNIATDPAFARRFNLVTMPTPDHDMVIAILKRRLQSYQDKGLLVPPLEDGFLDELVELSDAYVRDQVDPAKSLAVLASAVGYCNTRRDDVNQKMDHQVLKFVFDGMGYNIDSTATADHVIDVVHKRVKGQPLAIKMISDAVNTTYYTKRDRKRPFMTIISVGTTGTGKTETAKAIAMALYGREDAMIDLNGGDYPEPKDAVVAQHFIGDQMATKKQKVILLDEIEKSHPDVLNGYMRMIDEGIVRDSRNIERSVNNTVIIATSNLGAQIFSELADSMNLNRNPRPDELTPALMDAWYGKESSVRKALQEGDVGRDNGIRPEFLDRFQMMIPYLPLPKKVQAQIARMKLVKFQKEQAEAGYQIQLPSPLPASEWQRIMPKSVYENIDSVSVMIAEDIINSEASTAGARAINRFMATSVKPKVANAIAIRKGRNQSIDGVFQITTNGHAIFEDSSQERPDIKVRFVERGR